MQKVKFKKSVVQGKKPSSLEAGEIAINYNAKTPFLSFQTSGDTSEIVQIAPTQSYFVKGTQTSATNAFTGELLGISELKSGLAIDYWLPYNGTSSPATLNLTISDSTGGTKTTGAIAVYAKGTTRVTTHYTASNVIHMVYTKEGGTNGRTEGWWVTSYYDTNTDSATTYNGHYTPSSSETKAYSASAGQYITGITLQRDGKGHVTGITGTTATLSDKDSYISAAAFSATAGNVTMSLTRAGSTTGTVTATIPVATSAACGVVKIITGDLKSKTYTVGEAAAAAHTHSQYSPTGHTHSQYSETGHTHSTYLKNPTASTTADTIYIVGIKTGATQTGLYDSGVTITNASVKAKNGFFQTSDERLKTFTEDIEVNLDKLSELPKKKYYWTEDKDKVESIGTSAQKVRELFPEVVNVNEDGYLSVDYAKLSIVALAAIDELNKKNKLLEERLERLEKALLK